MIISTPALNYDSPFTCPPYSNYPTCFWQEPQEKILTNHPADDRYGNYSPDGDQIIFESNREGNWDIFVMEGNGKHQTKLTSRK